MDFEYRTPFYTTFVRSAVTGKWDQTPNTNHATATAALLIATREKLPAVIYKGFEGDENLYRENFNDLYRIFKVD